MLVNVLFIVLAIGITMSAIMTAFIESVIENPKKYKYSPNDPVLVGLADHFSSTSTKLVFRFLMIFLWPYIVCCALLSKKTETAKAPIE